MLGKKVLNNFMGQRSPMEPLQPLKRMKRMKGLHRIKADNYSKCREANYCEFCGSKAKKHGKFINYDGSMAFMCNDCVDYKEKNPDWRL